MLCDDISFNGILLQITFLDKNIISVYIIKEICQFQFAIFIK